MTNRDMSVIVGIGARRGVTAQEVCAAVECALRDSGLNLDSVRMFASSRLKKDELGIIDAIRSLGREIAFLDDETINACTPRSPSEASRFGLVGVAEPSALALSNEKELILEKRSYGRVTIAIAR